MNLSLLDTFITTRRAFYVLNLSTVKQDRAHPDERRNSQNRETRSHAARHHASMTGYPERIEAARADVEALLEDAQELQRLHDERAAQLDELKASGSRDFARMAEVEGQRAALATMHTDQGAEVQRARAALAALEQEAARDVRLSRIGEIATETAQIHAEVRDGLEEVCRTLETKLGLLFQQEARWLALRKEWIGKAGELEHQIVSPGDRLRAETLYEELRGHGVDVDALLSGRFAPYEYEVLGQRDTLLMGEMPPLTRSTPFRNRLPWLLLHLYVMGWSGWVEANTYGAKKDAEVTP